MRRKNTIFDNVNPAMRDLLFPKNIFETKTPQSELLRIKEERDFTEEANLEGESEWKDDFYMEHAMELGKWADDMYRDNYGNYDKDTYWYQKMEQNGFPYGEDEMPELLENDEFYD